MNLPFMLGTGNKVKGRTSNPIKRVSQPTLFPILQEFAIVKATELSVGLIYITLTATFFRGGFQGLLMHIMRDERST